MLNTLIVIGLFILALDAFLVIVVLAIGALDRSPVVIHEDDDEIIWLRARAEQEKKKLQSQKDDL